MKRMLALLLAVLLFVSVASAETVVEDVVAVLETAYSDAFDYYNLRFDVEESTLYVDVAIDGFAENMYALKEIGVDSTNESWNQIKGMLLTIYQSSVSVFEVCEVEAPEHIFLQLWNDDVAIRNDHTTGKSRILLAIHNGMFYIDEMEVH